MRYQKGEIVTVDIPMAQKQNSAFNNISEETIEGIIVRVGRYIRIEPISEE